MAVNLEQTLTGDSLFTNSVVHVTEQILEPPNIVKMLDITDQYAALYNVSIVNNFFASSSWDPNNLWRSLGTEEGQRLTLLAPLDSNFAFSLFDWEVDWKERSLSPEWFRHVEDLLFNLFSDSLYTQSDLDDGATLATIGGATYNFGSGEESPFLLGKGARAVDG
jgi:hypothetical protein